MSTKTDIHARYETLIENDKRLKTLFNHARIGLIYMNSKGFVENSNREFTRITAIEQDELLGKHVVQLARKFVKASELHDILKAVKQLLGRKRVNASTIAFRKKMLEIDSVHVEDTGGILTMIRDVSESVEARRKLEYRIRFEKLIAMVSARFINVSSREIDDEINTALKQIGQFEHVDHSYIIQFSSDSQRADNTHEWTTKGMKPALSMNQNIDLKKYAWAAREITENGLIHIPDVLALPDDALAEKEFFASQGVKSLVLVPMAEGEQLTGLLGLDTFGRYKTWTEDSLRLLQIVADSLSSAMARRKSGLALQAHEAEREKLFAELEKKNEELERFTYMVSHDLKSPLITIKGFLKLIEKDAHDENKAAMETDVHHLNVAVDNMTAMLNDLLELSRLGRVVHPKTVCALSELAREAAVMLQGRIDEHHVDLRIAPDLPAVEGDRLRLVEVFMNLIDNAIKFMENQTKPCIEVGIVSKEGRRVYYVRDNGKGIDAQHQEQIFELFNKLESDAAGTGVGLAIVKRIVELHEGRLYVESKGAEQGSTFYFTLWENADTHYVKAGDSV